MAIIPSAERWAQRAKGRPTMDGGWVRQRFLLFLLGVLTASTPAAGEEISLLWRSPFGNPRAVAVSLTDGRCWAATGDSVMRLSASDVLRGQTDGFSSALGLAVCPDSSCWVADTYRDQVVHLAANGTELWRGGVFDRPTAVAVDPGDGSCWVADSGNGQLVRLDAGGVEQARFSGYSLPDPETGMPVGRCLSVDPSDGSCWVADEGNGRVLRVSSGGSVLVDSRILSSPRAVAVNIGDGSCWVADPSSARVVHLGSDGTAQWEGTDFTSPIDVSVDPMADSCLVADAGAGLVRCLLSGGTEIWRWEGDPRAVAASPFDGSCWVANRRALGSVTGKYELVHLASDGEVLARHGGLTRPASVSVDHVTGSCWMADHESGVIARITPEHALGVNRPEPSQYQPRDVSAITVDGSCWIAEEGGGLVRLSWDGVEILRDRRFMVTSVSGNPYDGSCWAGVAGGGTGSANEVYHFGSDLATHSHTSGFSGVSQVCLNARDSTCWVADQGSDVVVHLGTDGAEIGRCSIDSPRSVSVNAFDGSIWVASADEEQETSSVSHLLENGAVLWSSDTFVEASWVAVNPTDGSCWVADWGAREIVHLAEDGTELGRVGGFWRSRLSVNPVDGSCWVSDEDNGQVAHLGVSGYEGPTFPDLLCYQWCYDEVQACVDAGIVAGYGDGCYHWEVVVTRDQMAVYVARALAGGDAYVDPPSGPPTFFDVSDDHWAYKYVEYAVANNIVAGYGDGSYRPDVPVDRAQMAVYIARSVVDPTGDEGLISYVPPPTPTFPDVPAYFWSFLHIEYCAGEGIVYGYLDGKYHPEYLVTRDQMAVYICRAFDLLQ
jgi:DNA-binding beta-propeller fold protein YncE